MSHRTRNLKRTIRANDYRRRMRANAGEHQPTGLGYPGKGTVNAYRCTACGELTVTIHRDPGVTPMFLECRASQFCPGRAISGMYRAPADRLPPPAWEWWSPVGKERAKLAGPVRDHVDRGGLLLRELAA